MQAIKPPTLTQLLLLVTSLIGPSSAFDPTTRDCESICLTSFRWCSTLHSADGCTYPADSYPYYDREEGSNPAMLVMSKSYNITWKNAVPNTPVRIRWMFTNATEASFVGVKGDTTNSFYNFTLGEILDSFPTAQAPNLSAGEARSGAARNILNIISIAQPEAKGAQQQSGQYSSGAAVGDSSQQFTVQGDIVRTYLEAAASRTRRDEHDTWKLGSGWGSGWACRC
ncbi:Uu.00g032940.m01.CDS01 [Anthostomella pinea]|uniref:Uu.00g032940.m01.CDS01 n=1 Tax=Anthostomella pinea TaxID=933095 RepID=A0AAI8V9T5_9PEZI|nr:Uu.00g032940.m01.CDS01 [Anthostomella pinea]